MTYTVYLSIYKFSVVVKCKMPSLYVKPPKILFFILRLKEKKNQIKWFIALKLTLFFHPLRTNYQSGTDTKVKDNERKYYIRKKDEGYCHNWLSLKACLV